MSESLLERATQELTLLQTPLDRPTSSLFADFSCLVDFKIKLLGKLEQFNAAGSLKIKPAIDLVQAVIASGRASDATTLVDTSSGNMAIALCVVGRAFGLKFLCVTDEKITTHNRALVEAYGGAVVIMPGSAHAERSAYIAELEASDPSYVWTRQFEDKRNPKAHELTTAQEIFNALPRVDAIFVGVGTGGTIAGCAAVRDKVSPTTRIVAVDPQGSNHFPQSRAQVVRRIPGIGATQRSGFLDAVQVDEVSVVSDAATIETCLLVMDRTGWLLGGSSGSVLHAAVQAAPDLEEGSTVVAICADSGERYLSTIYNREWRRSHGFAAD